jgi:hypothetical protein
LAGPPAATHAPAAVPVANQIKPHAGAASEPQSSGGFGGLVANVATTAL